MDFLKGLFKTGATAAGFGWIPMLLKALPIVVVSGAVLFFGAKVVSCTQAKNIATITAQKVVIKDVGEANKELAKDNINIEASGKATVNTVVATNTQVTNSNNKAAAREINVKKKITTINAEINSLPEKSIESEKERIDRVSTVQIDAMWAAYCDAAPTSTQCQVKS